MNTTTTNPTAAFITAFDAMIVKAEADLAACTSSHDNVYACVRVGNAGTMVLGNLPEGIGFFGKMIVARSAGAFAMSARWNAVNPSDRVEVISVRIMRARQLASLREQRAQLACF